MHPWSDHKKYFLCLKAKNRLRCLNQTQAEMPLSKMTNPTAFPQDFPCLEMCKVPWSLPVVLPIQRTLATALLLCMPSVSSQARHLKLYLKGNKQSTMILLVTFSDVLKENSLLVIKEFSKVPNTLSLLLKNRKVLSVCLYCCSYTFKKSE